MNGLKQVSLIKSAKFDFAQVDIDGNSLFIGANGAGKTTLLRAILYFYTASSKGLGISSSKKIVFSEYYFEYENSYIAYVYKKDDNYILVTAYNDSGVKFRFTLLNSMPNIKEIYIKDDKPLLKGELFIKLKELGTTSNIIPNGVKYKEVLYSKNHSLRYFSLFEAKEYDGFIKTLSNIFINSKVDSNAIKKVIVSSLGIENTIDLNSISRYLENFNNYFEDIKSYESQQNKIKKVLDILQEYEQTKVLLQDDISTLLNSKQIIEKQYSDISISIDKQTQQKNTLKDKQQHEQNLYIKRKDKLNQSKGACDSFIKLSNSKKNHYEKIDISERIKEYESLPLLNSRLKDIVSKKEFLTKEVGSLQHYHELQLQSIENSFISNTNDQNEKLHSLKQELSSKQNTLKQKEQQDIVNIQEKYTKKLFELKDNRSALLSNIQDEKYNKKDILNNQFIYSEEQKLQTYIQKHTIVTQTINENKQKLILENKELETIENIYHKELEYIKKSFDKDTQELNKKIQAIQKLITPQKDTLAESIYKNTKGDISKYFYFLKDDVLSSKFDVKFTKDSDKIFEICFDSLDIDTNKQDIHNELQVLKNNQTKLHKSFLKEQEFYEKQYKQQQSKIYKRKKQLNDKIKDDEVSLITLNTKISNLKTQKSDSLKKFEDDKQIKTEKIDKSIETLSTNLKLIDEDISKNRKTKENEIKTLKSSYTKEQNKSLKEYKPLIENVKQTIQNLKDEKDKNIKEQTIIYHKKLNEKSIDTKSLEKLVQKSVTFGH